MTNTVRTYKRHTRSFRRKHRSIHRREHAQKHRYVVPAKIGVKHRSFARSVGARSVDGVRPALDIIVKRDILTVADIDPATVAEYIDDFMEFLKQRTGWHVHINREALQIKLADIIAVIGPTIEFALQVKGKDVDAGILERFVLSLINALIVRINLHAKTNFVIDDSTLESLAITFRSVYNALQQDWSKIDTGKQTNASSNLLSRCLPGCWAVCR